MTADHNDSQGHEGDTFPSSVTTEHGAPTYTRETITPAMAEEYLAMDEGNRILKPTVVTNYEGRMERGEWVENGETIIFDWDGKLRDGQHRLHAVIGAGVDITTGVVRGVDPSSFVTIDDGSPRTHADVLGIDGHENPKLVASCVVAVYAYLAEQARLATTATKIQKSGFLRDHPTIHESVMFTVEAGKVSSPGWNTLHAPIHYLLSRSVQDDEGRVAVDRWVRRLITGEDIDGPLLMLREKLIGEGNRSRRKPSRWSILKLVLSVWARMARGEEVKQVKIPSPSLREHVVIPGFPSELFLSQIGQDDDEAEQAAAD